MEERRRAHDLYPAVNLRDLFFERVNKDANWTLFDPNKTKSLEGLYGDEFNREYQALERDGYGMATIKAKELWKTLLRQYFETGMPFLFNVDEANRRNPNRHVGSIKSSNLCVTGDTRLATQFGLVKAKDLYESEKGLITTYDKRSTGNIDDTGVDTYEAIPMQKTAINADVYKVTLRNGQYIKSTDWHEYPVLNYAGTVVRKALKDIKVGDTLLTQSGKGQFGTIDDVYAAVEIATHYFDRVPDKVFEMTEESTKVFLNELLSNEARLLTDDTTDGDNQYLSLSHDSVDYLLDLQMILANFGVASSVMSTTLYIYKEDIFDFYTEVGTLHGRLDVKHMERTRRGNVSEIVSIEYAGKEDVYDTTQELNHYLIFNGIATSNCTEISQNTSVAEYGARVKYEDHTYEVYDNCKVEVTYGANTVVKDSHDLQVGDMINGKRVIYRDNVKVREGDTTVCNLMSVNLEKVNTNEDLERVVPIAIRFLDNVITMNLYPIQSAYETSMRVRSVGLGLMGGAAYAAQHQLLFGSEKHRHAMSAIYEKWSFEAIKASMELAIERGSYPDFEGSDWSKGILPVHTAKAEALELIPEATCDWNWLAPLVQQNGIRNGYIMSPAPTSSISLLVGTTSAHEPIYKRVFFEENTSGMIKVIVPKLSPDTWQYYIPSYDVDQEDSVKHNAVLAIWVDQAASCNYFFKTDTTGGKLNAVYQAAWKYGVKSSYYLRSESPDAVASMEAADETKYVECKDCQ